MVAVPFVGIHRALLVLGIRTFFAGTGFAAEAAFLLTLRSREWSRAARPKYFLVPPVPLSATDTLAADGL